MTLINVKPPEAGLRSGQEPSDKNVHIDKTAALLGILQLEADIRRINSEKQMIYHMANESRTVLGFRQAVVMRYTDRWQVEAVSSVTVPDKDSPLNRDIVKLLDNLTQQGRHTKVHMVDLSGRAARYELNAYPFSNGLWLPMIASNGQVFAGLLILHDKPWAEAFLPLAERVRDTYAHAWNALVGNRLVRRTKWKKPLLILATCFLITLIIVRVPLTVLAPVEVTGQERTAITSPISGSIKKVAIVPNSVVSPNLVLAVLEDSELKSELEIAEREMTVRLARLAQLQSAAFFDRDAARELKATEAELALAQTEVELAKARLSRVNIHAPMSGIAIFNDPRELTGKPVAIGERIMEIADPALLEFTIIIPVDDSIVLQNGARVRVFLDSAPLKPLEAQIVQSSYHASAQEDGSFGYKLIARSENIPRNLRLGAHGVAQVFGQKHSLFFIIFRRPLSWMRQTFGI